MGSSGHRSEPLLEVTYVTVKGKAGYALDSYNTSNKKKSLLVYGQIYVCNGNGAKYFLYDRARQSAESIPVSGGALSLQDIRGQDGKRNVAISMFAPLLSVDLKVKGNGKEEDDTCLYQGTGEFGAPKLCHHEFKSLILSSEVGDVCVNYWAMPCATCVYVIINVNRGKGISSHQGNSPYGYVYGSVVASYKLHGVELRDPNKQIVLYKRLSKRDHRVECGDDIMLSKSMLCVPSYASLILHLNLSFKDFGPNKETFNLVECREFKAFACSSRQVYIQLPSPSGVFISLYLRWRLPGYFGNVQLLKRTQSSLTSIDEDNRYLMESAKFECFSVAVGGGNWSNDELELYGRVRVVDATGDYYLFLKDKYNPALLSRVNNTIPLEGLKTYHCWFCMAINLMDIQGRVFCHGDVSIGSMLDDNRDWCDKLLCSVITGEHGYVVVHYAIFSLVSEAKMDFYLVPDDPCIELRYIRGTIAAYYSCFDYSASYVKSYYGIVLYESVKPQEFHMEKGLPLSRSVVSVPKGAFLIVDVDLYVTSSKGNEEHLSKYGIELKGKRKIDVILEGSDCNVKCLVTW